MYMTTAKEIFSPVYELVGETLTDIGVYYDLLKLTFGEYEIHASCFARVTCDQKVLFTTQDYQSWDEKESKHNDLYINIADHGGSLIDRTVQSVEVSSVNDLIIVLDNGARIEIFNSNGGQLHFTEWSEQWFFFKPKNESYPYLSVSNGGVEREVKES